MNLTQIFLLELNNTALNGSIFFGQAVGRVFPAIRTRGIDEGIAFGHVSIRIFKVIAHFNIKINVIRQKDQY